MSLPPGSPIPALGGAGGRRYTINFHVAPLENNTYNYAGDFDLVLRLITGEFLNYVANSPGTLNGGIDCEVEVFGVDHNGHDVKVVGSLHVEVF